MLPPKRITASADQQNLNKIFQKLGDEDRHALLAFAEYLDMRAAADGTMENACAVETVEPLDIPRPAGETVIAAIRRLSATYPMLEKDLLLHDTADLMSAHVLQGRTARDVIDELEGVFRRHFERVNSDDDSSEA